MMERHLKTAIDELLYDIANYGYIEGHKLESLGGSTEAAHMLTDICAEGNVDRVKLVLERAWLTVKAYLDPGHPSQHHTDLHHSRGLLRSLVREYMVSCVMADWLGIVHAEWAPPWAERAAVALSALRSHLQAGGHSHRRPTAPW